MASPLDLVTDPVFLARIQLAFAAAAYQIVTTIDPNLKPDSRKAQLQAIAKVIDPARAADLAQRAALLIVGSPEVLAQGVKVTAARSASVVGKVLGAFSELASLGGAL